MDTSIVVVCLYLLGGAGFYAMARSTEGPQGIGGLIASLLLGSLTVAVLVAVGAGVVLFAGLQAVARRI